MITNGISSFFKRVKRGFKKLFFSEPNNFYEMRLENQLDLQDSKMGDSENSVHGDFSLNLIHEQNSQASNYIQELFHKDTIGSNSFKNLPAAYQGSFRKEQIREDHPENYDDRKVQYEKSSDQLTDILPKASNSSSSKLLGHKRVNSCVLSESSNFGSKILAFNSPFKSTDTHFKDAKPSSISVRTNKDCSSFILESGEKYAKSINDSNLSIGSGKCTKPIDEIKRHIQSKRIENRIFFYDLKKKEESRNLKEVENRKKVLQCSALNENSGNCSQIKFKDKCLGMQSSTVSIYNQKYSGQEGSLLTELPLNKMPEICPFTLAPNPDIKSPEPNQIFLSQIEQSNRLNLVNLVESVQKTTILKAPTAIIHKEPFIFHNSFTFTHNFPRYLEKKVEVLQSKLDIITQSDPEKCANNNVAEQNVGLETQVENQHTSSFTEERIIEPNFIPDDINFPRKSKNNMHFNDQRNQFSGTFYDLVEEPKLPEAYRIPNEEPLSIYTYEVNKIKTEDSIPKVSLFGLNHSNKIVVPSTSRADNKGKSTTLREEYISIQHSPKLLLTQALFPSNCNENVTLMSSTGNTESFAASQFPNLQNENKSKPVKNILSLIKVSV